MDFVKLFSNSSPSVLGFISKLSIGTKPHFPSIFGTGFFVDSRGLAATNRHVIEAFANLPAHPKSGESSLAAVGFFPADDESGWQMLVVPVVASYPLAEFSASVEWYGQNPPDIGFVQLGVREVPTLQLATEAFYARIGMDVATIGYPMGNAPLMALKKLNQVSPFIRRGIISSLFPCPAPLPHGFTMDIMHQGGSSGSPVLRASDGVVIGMMSSMFPNTNISIAEPAHIIQKGLEEFSRTQPTDIDGLPTLAELKARYPKPSVDQGLTWESWVQSKT
jgi:hypothetical protein